MLTQEEFLKKFADVPLSQRMIPVNMIKSGRTNILDINKEVRRLNNSIEYANNQKQKLFDLAEEFFNNINK